MTSSQRGAAVLAFLLAMPSAVGAQQALAVRRADSLALAGDSIAALATLDSAIHSNRHDAAAMHRRGLLAWGMARDGRRQRVMKKDDIKLLRMADSSLRLAVAMAPDSAQFAVDLGRFYLNSDLATLRFQAHGLFERALEAAEKTTDEAALADAADELGMSFWRRYEAVANRYNFPDLDTPDFDKYAWDPRGARAFVEQFAIKVTGFPGEMDYTKAHELFLRATEANRDHPRALRHTYMVLAERERWEELRRIASTRIGERPWDAWAWLARGLASHRSGDYRDAAASYDSAFVFLTPDERERFTRLSRILRKSDSARIAGLDPAARARTRDMYWLLSDPLWLTSTNEHRLEFLSRVAFAELRWTSDDLDKHGADTDRGDIHVRYGPPRLVIGLAPPKSRIVWMYEDGLTFVFYAPPTWGTASFDGPFLERARQLRETQPVEWSNLPVDRQMDSIAVQLARFRAGGDSVDVFLVANVPIDSLVKDVEVAKGPIDIDMQVFDDAAQPVMRDSSRAIVSFAAPDLTSLRAWRPRVGKGTYFYRIEALQPDAMNGARGSGRIPTVADSTFALRGFGISDILLAERVAPRAGDASRWSEFTIVPNTGVFRRGQSVDLLWETYDLGQRDGAARYKVSITLSRVRGTGAGAWVARVIGGAADAIGATGRGSERVALSFDRQVPCRAASADYVSLDLGAAPPGRYRVTVEITDQVTSRKTVREARLTIAP